MIKDFEATDLRPKGKIYDVCIIGSGPAGLSIAKKLSGSGLSVGVFEGGGETLTEESASIYEGTSAGIKYGHGIRSSRYRAFGGTSAHWQGPRRLMALSLDEADFLADPGSGLPGWPVPRSELLAYSPEAERFLGVEYPSDDLPFPVEGWDYRRGRFGYGGDLLGILGEHFTDKQEADYFINANLVDMSLDESGRINKAFFRSFNNPDVFEVEARKYVLACGGMENPRLLLNFNRQVDHGIGNESGFVGRCFSEHPSIRVGELWFPRDVRDYLEKRRSARIYLFPRESWLRDNFNFNHMIRVQPNTSSWWSPTNTRYGSVIVVTKQTANTNSRITLSDDKDALGLSRMVLDWRLMEEDVEGIRRAVQTISTNFARFNAGRVRIDERFHADLSASEFIESFDEMRGGNHHMGTTRMSGSPKYGVVDENCKVHGMGNLYIAGSSVFPTSGHANPTLTIVELSLRLSDHLMRVLSPEMVS